MRVPSLIEGHSPIAISSRYVHPSEDTVLSARSNLGGRKIGHSPKKANISARSGHSEVNEGKWPGASEHFGSGLSKPSLHCQKQPPAFGHGYVRT